MTYDPGHRSGCPIAIALDLIGDRWSLLVVRDLLFGGPRGFREFAGAPEGIASNILTDRLARLQQAGIIERRRDPADRRRVIYALTEKGVDLAPALVEIVVWSARHERTEAPKAMVDRMRNRREEFLAELRAKWDRNR
jgi:DNA-binding HxlR family transcriptional regulator